MKRVLKVSILALAMASATLSASESGAELFKAKCAVCHSMSEPTDKSKMVAPPAKGIMFHMGEAFKSDEKIKEHINSFVLNPTKEKAICKSVKRFGVMPSQKGNVSKEELEKIAEYMVKELKMTKAEHGKMEKGHHKGKGMMFEKLDSNGDGVISKEEFMQGRKGMHKGKGMGMHKGGMHGEGMGMHKGMGQ